MWYTVCPWSCSVGETAWHPDPWIFLALQSHDDQIHFTQLHATYRVGCLLSPEQSPTDCSNLTLASTGSAHFIKGRCKWARAHRAVWQNEVILSHQLMSFEADLRLQTSAPPRGAECQRYSVEGVDEPTQPTCSKGFKDSASWGAIIIHHYVFFFLAFWLFAWP